MLQKLLWKLLVRLPLVCIVLVFGCPGRLKCFWQTTEEIFACYLEGG